ncbi:putative membrane protein [Allopseudospirillum japonicum]|uniref:Protoporphyrinogen IX oxidase n=1 Tax=Allopseudospirillum japonicum TaxID=64971 RepID=A0A1H6TYR0_9GAMM|nr:protoporphyrinogen oxidase HemJ [Allopseudospirillum japonicum]SEI81390.1 putative membrane protein [Allopseudospirillum japonicum]
MTFLWLKAFHIMAIVTWFSGLFYLPRLFVYHAMAEQDEDLNSCTRFKVMERKLLRGITTPSMIVVVVLGIGLLSTNFSGYMSQGWMHAKLSLVALLLIYHVMCHRYVARFAVDQNKRGHVYYRIFNELPVFALIGIVILAVLKPF